jgi:hypothetical protein
MTFKIQGKLNYPEKKKVDGTVEVDLRNISLRHFSPYYSPVCVHLEVERGLADVYTRLQCKQNELRGASRLVIKDYTLKAKDKDGSSIIRIGEALKGGEDNLELLLRIGGTIYKPTYTLTTDISDAKMREFFNRLPGLDLSGTVLDGARRAGSGIGKTVGDMFGNLFFRGKRPKNR